MIPNLHERLIKLQSYVKLRLNPDTNPDTDAFYNPQLVDEEIFTCLQKLIDECNNNILFYGPAVYPTFVPEAWTTPTPFPMTWKLTPLADLDLPKEEKKKPQTKKHLNDPVIEPMYGSGRNRNQMMEPTSAETVDFYEEREV